MNSGTALGNSRVRIRPMNTVTSTIDITPTPFQARIQSPPQEWDLLLDGGRGGGKTYALILGGFHLAER